MIHLGHNRSVAEIVESAVQEDAQAVAVSSYQGGHIEFYRYLVDQLRERGASHVRVFGGGGGVIVPSEIRVLEEYGVTKIFSPDDGRRHGLQGIIRHMLESADFALPPLPPLPLKTDPANILTLGGTLAATATIEAGGVPMLARLITLVELDGAGPGASPLGAAWASALRERAAERVAPVVGITGPGGAGKSSLTDELVRRLMTDFPKLTIAILSIDPSKRKTGGALLGDRIRMNAIYRPGVYMRSLATRGSGSELSEATRHAIQILKAWGFDVIFVETSGIGQGASAVVDGRI